MSSTPPGRDEFVGLIESQGRRVYVTTDLINLGKLDQHNDIYILQLTDSSTAAGGRGGGLGERRVVKAFHYSLGEGECIKVAEFDDEERLESLDLPYHATAFPIILPDGKEKLVTGVVDGDLVASYKTTLGQ